MDAPISVWTEVRVSKEGVSATLYSESAEERPVVEDETWFTHDELESGDLKGVTNLSLSPDSREALRESDSQQLADSREFTEGKHVYDENAPEWSDEDVVRVVEVLEDVRADNYVIQGPNEGSVVEVEEQAWGDRTVACANPSYPEDDAVVIAYYVDGSGREYAFPASRLSTDT